MDYQNDDISKKQHYLKTKIIDEGYDPKEFNDFMCNVKNEESIDLSNWTLQEIVDVVNSFKEYSKKKDVEEKRKKEIEEKRKKEIEEKQKKDNGILIKSFYGKEDYSGRADTILEELAKILIKIAQEGGDLRKSIIKYKNEIVNKITIGNDI